mmetsp:Transcript_24474/g.48144  ORF Transcript_24474/g.48144 Transcript_24474/m.48144 type:complete len:92 (+) Transcript_24474:134-409(+)
MTRTARFCNIYCVKYLSFLWYALSHLLLLLFMVCGAISLAVLSISLAVLTVAILFYLALGCGQAGSMFYEFTSSKGSRRIFIGGIDYFLFF